MVVVAEREEDEATGRVEAARVGEGGWYAKLTGGQATP